MSLIMNIFRPVIVLSILSYACLYWGAMVSAQTSSPLGTIPIQPSQTQPKALQRVQSAPLQQGQLQAQPLQQQPVQAPLFGTNQASGSVYQNVTAANPAAQPGTPQGPIGNNRQASPTQPAIQQVQGGQMLYNPDGNRTPLTVQPSVQQPPQQLAAGQQPAAGQPPMVMPHSGRTEPVNRIVPFVLTPDEQRELDVFLARWEKYSTSIKRYDVNVNLHEYDMTLPGAKPNEATKVCFGYFKYIANPVRFAYVIEGEWRDGKYVKRDGDKNPDIYAEKTIIEEKRVFNYDYASKTVYQINVPSELIGKGIADSPLPLIFGAKAEELKQRFSMKIVIREDGLIWLSARPLLIEDQQEFKELEILLEKDLRARAIKKHDINDKSYKVFELKDTKINPPFANVFDDMKNFFTADKPIGWKLEVKDWIAVQPAQPAPALGVPQPQLGNPAQQYSSPDAIPLYQVR